MAKHTTKVLLISRYNPELPSKGLVQLENFKQAIATESTDISVDYCSVYEFIFDVNANDARIIYNGKDIASEYDVLLMRNMVPYLDFASALQRYASHHGLLLINEDDVTIPAYGKLSQAFTFAYNGLPTPHTIGSYGNKHLLDYLQVYPPTYPAIVKHNDGIKGLHNYLVHSFEELKKILSQDKHGFVVQPYVQNDGEIRVLTFGDNDPLVFKKVAVTGTHLNNTSQGGSVVALQADDVDESVLAMAKKAAHVTGREIGGVDILLGKGGKEYVLEVNHTAALASGTLLTEKRQAFTAYIRNLKGQAK